MTCTLLDLDSFYLKFGLGLSTAFSESFLVINPWQLNGHTGIEMYEHLEAFEQLLLPPVIQETGQIVLLIWTRFYFSFCWFLLFGGRSGWSDRLVVFLCLRSIKWYCLIYIKLFSLFCSIQASSLYDLKSYYFVSEFRAVEKHKWMYTLSLKST